MPDSVGSFGAVEVQRRGFTDRRLVSCPSEQCEVLLDVGYGLLPYPALYSLSAFRPVEVQVAALQGKEVRFLYAAHIDLRVLLQVMVERSRSGLHGTDDQEVRQGLTRGCAFRACSIREPTFLSYGPVRSAATTRYCNS